MEETYITQAKSEVMTQQTGALNKDSRSNLLPVFKLQLLPQGRATS
jgi:hypothetical protein